MRDRGLRPVAVARVLGAVLAAALVALAPARPAWAHNQLRASDPAAGAVLADPPAQVVLEFTESLNPTYTTIVVTGADSHPVPTTEPVISGTRGSVAFTQPLADGAYTVAYRVVSRDGHPVQGAFSFTVGRAAVPSTAAPSTAAPAGPVASDPGRASAVDADGTGRAPLVAAAGALILLAGGVAWLRRRGRGAR